MTARCRAHGAARARPREAGSATVHVLVAATVVLAVAVALGLAGSLLRAGARARAAADLAALAGADALGTGHAPCPAAEAVAAANGARLDACTSTGGTVTVVAVAAPDGPLRAWQARASARAEPGVPRASAPPRRASAPPRASGRPPPVAGRPARALARGPTRGPALPPPVALRVARAPPGYAVRVPEEASVQCSSCSSDVADGRRFCPSCGTPQAVGAGAPTGARAGTFAAAPTAAPPVTAAPSPAAMVLPGAQAAGGAGAGEPYGAAYPDDPHDDMSATRVLGVPAAGATVDGPVGTGPKAPGFGVSGGSGPRARGGGDGPALRERLAPAGAAMRRTADELADRYRTAPVDVRLALAGAVVTVVSFLLLPYADERGTAASIGGRYWWRPLTAVAATLLLATTLRARKEADDGMDGESADAPRSGVGVVDRLLAAVVIATIGATEAGLVGLVSRDAAGVRVGYYGMLAGLVLVLVATVRAARRRCGA
jgi:secretion/DNA translocation related TadE-like protein